MKKDSGRLSFLLCQYYHGPYDFGELSRDKDVILSVKYFGGLLICLKFEV
jgi:hypothetical protein